MMKRSKLDQEFLDAYSKLSEEARREVVLTVARHERADFETWMRSAKLKGGFRATAASKWLNRPILKQLEQDLLRASGVSNRRRVLACLMEHCVFIRCEDQSEDLMATPPADGTALREWVEREFGDDELLPLFRLSVQVLEQDHEPNDTADELSGVAEAETEPSLEARVSAHSADVRRLTDTLGDLLLLGDYDPDAVQKAVVAVLAEAERLRGEISEMAKGLSLDVPIFETPEEIEAFLEQAQTLEQKIHQREALEDLLGTIATELDGLTVDHKSRRQQSRLNDLRVSACDELHAAIGQGDIAVLPGPTEPTEWVAWAFGLRGDVLEAQLEVIEEISPKLAEFIETCQPDWLSQASSTADEEAVPASPLTDVVDTGGESISDDSLSEHVAQDGSAGGRSQQSPEAETVEEVAIDDDPVASPIPSRLEASAEPVLIEQEPIPVAVGGADSEWVDTAWRVIDVGDMGSAYWIARSFGGAARNELPDWILAACCGSVFMKDTTHALGADLLELVSAHSPPAERTAPALLTMGAAVHSALVAPGTGLASWLVAPDAVEGQFRPLLTALSEFAQPGIPLRSQDLPKQGDEPTAPTPEAVSVRAREWLAEAEQWKMKARRASSVWHCFVRPDGPVHDLLRPVIANRRSDVRAIRSAADVLGSRAAIIEHIDRSDTNQRRRTDRIISGPREQLIRHTTEAVSLATEWCEAVTREGGGTDDGDWLRSRCEDLRSTVAASMEVVSQTVAGLDESSKTDLHAAGRFLSGQLQRLCRTLQLDVDLGLPEWEDPYPLLGLSRDPGLEDILFRKLLWLPEVDLSLDPRVESSISVIRDAIKTLHQSEPNLLNLLDGWVATHDYRFVDDILAELPEDEAVPQRVRVRDTIEGSRASLEANKRDTTTLIERAVVDGVIYDERSDLEARLHAASTPVDDNFRASEAELEAIRSEIDAAKQARLGQLENRWREVASGDFSQVLSEEREPVASLIGDALERGDIRVVDEGLAQIELSLQSGGPIELPLDRSADDHLKDFLTALDSIREWLASKKGIPGLLAAIKNRTDLAGQHLRNLPKARLTEAREGVEAWRRLKGQNSRHDKANANVLQILQFLGLVPTNGSAIEVLKQGSDYLHLRANVSASDLARPVPQFGSLATPYQIVCFWDSPAAETLSARVAELQLTQSSVIAIYLNPLTSRHRRDLASRIRRGALSVAVIDECLLAYLCTLREARFPPFLRCALPFAFVNPYTPARAGNVPPEIFYGRTEMLNALLRGESSIVFGGRQLGKSALLKRVEAIFHNPDNDNYAWFKDIRHLGTKEHDLSDLWVWIRQGLQEIGLLDRKSRAVKLADVSRQIVSALSANPSAQVIVLLDEADRFLDEDAANDFVNVDALRTIMLETGRRFRVVLAGLHNVQRFKGIPNHPLAHFGDPICVGPLEPRPAQSLVRDPLEAVGFRLPDETVYTILSYTNYHPGLIQHFCHELLDRLNAKRPSGLPPHEISQEEVERTYLGVQGEIRLRLELTLGLDGRYQGIAWSMILDQLEQDGAFAESYAAEKLQDLASDSLPKVFSSMKRDTFRGFVDEMCGLGVLIRTPQGKYRLRSPNLVRLMGTWDQIFAKLEDLATQPMDPNSVNDTHHLTIDYDRQTYSPLELSQERMVHMRNYGVCLVVGSEACGIQDVLSAIRHTATGTDTDIELSASEEIPDAVLNDGRLGPWIDDYLKQHKSVPQLYAYARVHSQTAAIQKAVGAAQKTLRGRKNQRQWLRIVFALDPLGLDNWLTADAVERSTLEGQLDAVISLRPWSEAAIQQRLAHADMLESPEVCSELLELTGGWPLLLDSAISETSDNDPRPVARSLFDQIGTANHPLQVRFLKASGLDHLPLARRVFDLVSQATDGLPIDMVSPELLDEPKPLQENCDTALDYLIDLSLITQADGILTPDPIVRKAVGDETVGL